MATLESPDSNIYDAEAVNWRLIVYPLVALLILVVGGFSIYVYLQNQREEHEAQARTAFLAAKTPEALVQVAEEFPRTTHAVLALLQAASLSFDQKDYTGAEKDYQRVIDAAGTPDLLRDSARLGLASAQEAAGNRSDAIASYLVVARRGNATAYAPYAYHSAAHLYEQANDPDNERKILTEAAALGGDSPFVKEAQARLRTLSVGDFPITVEAPTNAAPGGPAAPH
jgi:predicted negative regulator of RcsB-dependent stress response